MDVRFSDSNRAMRITGAILEFAAIIFLFLPFIGLSFVALGIANGGISPFTAFMGAFLMIAAGGIATVVGLLYILLFLAAVVLPVLTGILALVNRKYFPSWISTIVYGAMCVLWAVIAIVINANSGSIMGELGDMLGASLGSLGMSITFLPTLWLILGAACVVAPAFMLRKENTRRIIMAEQPPIPAGSAGGAATAPIQGERTIPAPRNQEQVIKLRVSYSDDSGSHVVAREIRTNGPLTIGRASDNGLSLVDGGVSGHHARLSYNDADGMVIEDLRSTNGIQVNGETIMQKRKIGRNDTVRLGNSRLQFEVVGRVRAVSGEETIAVGPQYRAPVSIRLSFTDDSGPRTEHFTLMNSALIGSERGSDVNVWINSRTVTHKHAYLINKGSGQIEIEDNHSLNGVVVNGKQVTGRTPLATGDVVTLGNVNIQITIEA